MLHLQPFNDGSAGKNGVDRMSQLQNRGMYDMVELARLDSNALERLADAELERALEAGHARALGFDLGEDDIGVGLGLGLDIESQPSASTVYSGAFASAGARGDASPTIVRRGGKRERLLRFFGHVPSYEREQQEQAGSQEDSANTAEERAAALAIARTLAARNVERSLSMCAAECSSAVFYNYLVALAASTAAGNGDEEFAPAATPLSPTPTPAHGVDRLLISPSHDRHISPRD